MKKTTVGICFFVLFQILLAAAQYSTEVSSLMSFKKSSVFHDPNAALSDWTDNSLTPCSWHAVSCSSQGTVVSIDLKVSGLSGSIDLPYLAGGLPNLKRIDLSGNSFSAQNLSAKIPCSLETLDFSNNGIAGPIPEPSFITLCRQLSYVNLSGNSISSIPPGSSSIVTLDLSRNSIADVSILYSIFSDFPALNYLNFSENKLAGNLASITLFSCKALSVLDLSGNKISGKIPSHFAENSITHLDISRNNFSGNVSDFDYGLCGNLLFVDFSRNGITGYELSPSLSNCDLLETIDMSHNQLYGTIQGDLLGSLKSLKKLSIAGNQFSGEIPSELSKACGSLKELYLSENKLSGELPTSFQRCSVLETMNLGNNGLSGDFLTSVVSKLTSLKFLYVPFNNISGPIPISLTNCSNLRVLDLSSNAFSGTIPIEFSSMTSLEKILIPNNHLSGPIPPVLGSCKALTYIDLSFNDLTGPIPENIWALTGLTELVIWANSLTGQIPEGICENGKGNLETLILNNNAISGPIPKSISSCTNMIWMSLSGNRITGEIPDGIGDLMNLAILQMGNNSLSGSVPASLGKCRSLIWLDLNSNDLTGPLPFDLADQTGKINPGRVSGKEFAFVRNEGGTACRGAGGLVEFQGITSKRLESLTMVHSCPSTRIYTGVTVYTFSNDGSMIYLDLSYNSISGSIPETYGAMSYLHVLNLGHNSITGKIPDSFGGLKAIGVLDLSHNSLDGYIPYSLGMLSFLSDFDVSNNNLSGPIPTGGQLTTFPPARYENNSDLCNLPLNPCGSSNSPKQNNPKRGLSAGTRGFIGIILSVSCIIGLLFAFYRVKRLRSKEKKREKYIESLPTSGTSSWKLSSVHEPLSINVATFEKPLQKLTFAHLLEATNGFGPETLIGSGGFGEVYRARLKDGSIVAIKKLIRVTGQGDREFTAEMETIGKIKHRNLVPLLGYCKIGEERLLVYEYMTWGSLESVLSTNRKNLDWSARKKIAVGSARGLSFLHHSCIPHIIHRDMKSSNVLLDSDFEPRVSDFGMARLVNALDTHISVSTLAGTPGYVPPEYYQSFRCTTKGDVYSFGVVLLELVSGKRPINTLEFGEDSNLVGWAKSLYRDKRSFEIIDSDLAGLCEGEVSGYLRIAFACLEDRPMKRPTMIQVMSMFREIQGESENDIFDGVSNSIKET